jgi:hypothetical protein
LLFTVGHKNLTHSELVGCIVNGAVICAASLALTIFNSFYIATRIKPFANIKLLLVMLFVPLVGFFVNIYIVRQQKQFYKNAQLAKDPH